MIIPAIIPRSLKDLETTLELVSFSKTIQIDVVDGEFDDDLSWPYEPLGKVSEAGRLIKNRQVEVDLMVNKPVEAGRQWLEAGASALVFHIESLPAPNDALLLRSTYQFKLGWSLSNDTPLDLLYPLIEQGDFVQLMGIAEIGAQGQPFDERVLERVALLRTRYPELVISIDGGVTEDTITELQAHGANRFVVGSNILRAAQPEEQYNKLLKIISASENSEL